jgi:hypothetical protein
MTIKIMRQVIDSIDHKTISGEDMLGLELMLKHDAFFPLWGAIQYKLEQVDDYVRNMCYEVADGIKESIEEENWYGPSATMTIDIQQPSV